MSYTLEQARAAKEKAKQLFTSNVGVGITKVNDGYAVKVNLQEPLVDKENMPTAIDGVPVQFEVVGEIRKQPL
ncbi:MAG TPA: hypothetical protein VKV39_20775 [Candidatus Sulfotelmatobacter sp.]|nr:hypothetical protein [Candidatus Sulfotelmatobacter sp.]